MEIMILIMMMKTIMIRDSYDKNDDDTNYGEGVDGDDNDDCPK